MPTPLMPKATAIWLLDNTALPFDQIADFGGLHILEIQSLADSDTYIVGIDPVASEQLTIEEIQKGLADPSYRLHLRQQPKTRRTSGPKYTPLNRRQDKPDAVAWVLAHHPELKDAQIMRLIGTTKNTIDKIKSRQHVDIKNIKPRHPVELGICSISDLEAAVASAQQQSAPKVKKTPEPKATKTKPAPKKKPVKKDVTKKGSAKKTSAKKKPRKKG